MCAVAEVSTPLLFELRATLLCLYHTLHFIPLSLVGQVGRLAFRDERCCGRDCTDTRVSTSFSSGCRSRNGLPGPYNHGGVVPVLFGGPVLLLSFFTHEESAKLYSLPTATSA